MRARRAVSAALAALALVAACSDDGGEASSDSDGTETTAERDRSAEPAYADEGDHAVGLTTLQLADRVVQVLYPATEGTGAPAEDLTLESGRSVLREARASGDGPFPVLLYSHGFGGSPLVSANLQAGIASWGFVVAAPDHIERNTTAVAGGNATPDAARDVRTVEEALAAVLAAAEDAGSVLAGSADEGQVATAGHSAGGGTALNALRLPEVAATVTWAGVEATDEPLPDEPVLVLGAEADIAVTGDEQRAVYEELSGPKRLVQLDGGAGHATFIDLCVGARQEVIDSGQPRPPLPGFAALAIDGCDADDVDPVEAWRLIQHFTVAHLRDALGVDEEPVGLADGVLEEFPEVPTRYEQVP